MSNPIKRRIRVSEPGAAFYVERLELTDEARVALTCRKVTSLGRLCCRRGVWGWLRGLFRYIKD